MASLPVESEEEEAVPFDTTHYKNGINGDFFGAMSSRSSEQVIAEFAGSNGGGGKFEDTEKRDIARAVPAICALLRDVVKVPASGTLLDIGAGTGLLLKPFSELVPQGQVLGVDISPDFRAWMEARVKAEGLTNVTVRECTAKDPLPLSSSPSPAGAAHPPVDLAVMCDVYHHVEYPRTVMKNLRRVMNPAGASRLVVIDFYRDPAKVTSRGPDWPLVHLRAGQDVFREEILSAGWALVCEPEIEELNENYVMVFRPKTDEEVAQDMSAAVGAGWAEKPVPATPTTTTASTAAPSPTA